MEIGICEHRFGDGKMCRGLALKGERYCRHHLRYKDKHDITAQNYEMPDLEDIGSVQLLVNETMRGIVSGKLDQKHARNVLWGASIASANLTRLSKHKPPAEDVIFCESCMTMLQELRELIIATGPEAGRSFGDVLDSKIARARDERKEHP